MRVRCLLGSGFDAMKTSKEWKRKRYLQMKPHVQLQFTFVLFGACIMAEVLSEESNEFDSMGRCRDAIYGKLCPL